jgi:hypothetical protein
MSYSVKSIDVFERQAKKLINKYPSLKSELFALIQELKHNSIQGTSIGKNCYKIRIAIKSKGKGKRGGARVITYIVLAKETIFLLSLFDKSSKESLTNKELEELLRFVEE